MEEKKKIDIKEVLLEKAPIIDKTIEKFVKRHYDKEAMEFTCGPARYSYNLEAPNKAIAEPIWDLLDRGGKRWRPTFFLLTCEALGGDPEKVFDFVVIPEVVHNGSLVVDDIEDNSDLRRGKPCTYKLFGVDVAVNAGNAMYYLPTLAFIKNRDNFDAETLVKGYEIFNQELINIHFGQGMDIAWHKGIANADNITEQEYLQMCAYKTGTLARLSAKLGALFSNGTDEQVEAMGKFAESIGVAFQIQDDLLNLFATSGESQFTEEYLGSDISEGKRSLIVIRTLQQASDEDRSRLLEILKLHSKERNIIKEAIEIINKYDAQEYCREFAKNLVTTAWVDVDSLLEPSDAKDKLKAFADYLIERDY